KWITQYFNIPASAVIACKNGIVRPSATILWCSQEKIRRSGDTIERLQGNATLVDGSLNDRGNARTADADADANDCWVTSQDADTARYFQARNLPRKRPRVTRAPWTLEPRCGDDGTEEEVDDEVANYPAVLASTVAVEVSGPGSGSGSGIGFGSGG